MNCFYFRRNSNTSRSFGKPKRGRLIALTVIVAAATAIAAGPCDSLLLSVDASVRSQVELPPSRTQAPQGNLPDSAVLIALGHDSKVVPLQDFANRIERQLHRKVVTYREFANAHYISQTGKWWDHLPFKRITATVEQAIRRAVDQYPNYKVIAFNLDTYDPREFFEPDGEEAVSYTNFEVRLLLCEQRLFLATRWYRNGRELSLDEAEAFWTPVMNVLREKQCFRNHLRQEFMQ